jgi:hypothetical protein
MTARKILLPKIPSNIVQEVYNAINDITDELTVITSGAYEWISANKTVQDWCKDNICPDMHWGIQVISGNLEKHKDIGTTAKFNYIIDSAGSNVETVFFDDNFNIIEVVVFEEHSWYILDVSIYHEVTGIERNKKRISLTGRIFPSTKEQK